MKELGKMLKHIQSFGDRKGQKSSQFGGLLFPTFPPVLDALIRKFWAIYGFLCLIITFASSSIQKHSLNYLEAFIDTSTKKRRKKREAFRASLTEVAFDPNQVFSTIAFSKTILDNMAYFLAVGASLYSRKGIILSPHHIFFDINAKIMYYHHVELVRPWGIPYRIELPILGILQGCFSFGVTLMEGEEYLFRIKSSLSYTPRMEECEEKLPIWKVLL